jgi:hypothetical protein
MNLTARGIEKFLAVVTHCPDHAKVLESLQLLQRTEHYHCPTVSVFALHLILDLYSEASSLEANVNRITLNLEVAADELNYFSQCIKVIR